MPVHFPRQSAIPSGVRTISANPIGTALSTDSLHTGTASGLSAPTITVSSVEAPTTTTVVITPSSTPVSNSGSTINLGVIIGITVGLFIVLAAALILYMTIRHKRRRKRTRARAMSAARKARSRLQEDSKPAEMQMRATNLANTASIGNSDAPVDQNSILPLTFPRGFVMEDQVASPPGNPTQHSQGSGPTRGLAAQPSTRSAYTTYIPNPFASEVTSPSHSPSTSHTSTYSSQAPSLSPVAMGSFAPHTPQYAYTNAMTVSSASDSQYSLPSPMNEPSPPKAAEVAKSVAPPASARLVRKYSTKAADETRSRELQAIQDLISALDERAPNKQAPPSAFNLKIDTNGKHEKSRLSMGEGLVTPGGHSIQGVNVASKHDHDGSRYAHKDTLDQQEHIPLPPPETFRAALSPGGGQRKVDKGKGKEMAPNPFEDRAF